MSKESNRINRWSYSLEKNDKKLLDTINHLVETMDKGDLVHLKVQDKEGFSVELEKKGRVEHVASPHPHPTPPVHHVAPSAPTTAEPAPAAATQEGEVLKSPMVGMFYRSSSPEDAPFVKVGDTVTADTVVCIIEAMKVMNEVKAGMSGVVAEIYAENGHPVEYDSKLIRIK